MKNVNVNEAYLLKLQVFDTSVVRERSGVSEKTGKPWNLRTQEVYVNLGGQFPVLVNIHLDEGQAPYPTGFYYIHPASFRANGFGELQVSRNLVLVPVEESGVTK